MHYALLPAIKTITTDLYFAAVGTCSTGTVAEGARHHEVRVVRDSDLAGENCAIRPTHRICTKSLQSLPFPGQPYLWELLRI